jgi:nitrate reductase NapAB chaperone NapD
MRLESLNNNILVISQADLSLEAGKLVVALQEFISSLIVQSRASQLQKIKVDLKGRALPQ